MILVPQKQQPANSNSATFLKHSITGYILNCDTVKPEAFDTVSTLCDNPDRPLVWGNAGSWQAPRVKRPLPVFSIAWATQLLAFALGPQFWGASQPLLCLCLSWQPVSQLLRGASNNIFTGSCVR